jgi:hypothetical protein
MRLHFGIYEIKEENGNAKSMVPAKGIVVPKTPLAQHGQEPHTTTQQTNRRAENYPNA